MSSLIIHNAQLLSFHEGGVPSAADAIAIKGDLIEAIGTLEDLMPLIDASTQLIDAGGKTLMPGFNDTHIHLWKVGNLKTFMLDLRPAGSLDEMLSLLESYGEQHPELPWITARGFNEAAWKEGRLPTCADLDKVIKNKPVYVIRTCAHIGVANTKAMELCGINSRVRVPAGGVAYKSSGGALNGVFSETALSLIADHLPAYTKSQLKQMVRAARDEMYRYGITAATDPAVDPLLLEAYYEMHDASELGFRLNALPIILPDGGEKPYAVPETFSSAYFNVNTVKFFSDGGLSGKTSALKKYYKNTREQGVLRLKKDQFLRLSVRAMEKGWGVATHAIGDAAIEMVLDVYKTLHKDFKNNIKRIEHLGLPEEKDLIDMAAHQVAASMQTIFIAELGKNFIRYLDEEYLDRCYPVKTVLKHGILTALSSDAPVVSDFNPLTGAKAAVTRQTNEGAVIASGERITIEEALKSYTIGAAAISGAHQMGALAKNKWADLILLSKNPLSTAPEELHTISVEKTFVGGKCVWESAKKN